ncbi:hypothetical protein K8I61_15870, partial [bacterium]|nr:hypothetical protein [bacterium]
MSEHAPRQTDSLTRIAVYPLAAAGFVAAYAAGVATIRAGYSQMERSMADTLLAQDDPFSRVAIAAAVFAALGAAHVATDIVRGQPTRGIGVLCLPMLLVAAFVPSSDALVLAVAATMALVAGRRLIENADLPRPVAPRAWPRSLRFLYVPALIALVLLAVSVCRVPARFWVAPAVFALFAIVSALSLGPRGRALLAVEGIVAFVPLTGGIVYALM